MKYCLTNSNKKRQKKFTSSKTRAVVRLEISNYARGQCVQSRKSRRNISHPIAHAKKVMAIVYSFRNPIRVCRNKRSVSKDLSEFLDNKITTKGYFLGNKVPRKLQIPI